MITAIVLSARLCAATLALAVGQAFHFRLFVLAILVTAAVSAADVGTMLVRRR